MYLRSVANGNLQRSPQPLISIDWTSCPRSCCLNCVELAVALGTGVALRLTVASNRASCGNRDHLAVITHPNDSALEFVCWRFESSQPHHAVLRKWGFPESVR